MTNLAVFASGTGSNFDAIQEAIERGDVEARISLVVSDRPASKVVEKARAHGIEVLSFQPGDFTGKAGYEQVILGACREHDIDWIVLAGYMRLIGTTLLTPYEGRILNIHPSLLPAFPGKNAVRQALQGGVSVTGVTVHLVDEGMDTGPILDQQAIRIDKDDTEEMVQQRIQQVEHVLYPEVIGRLVKGEKERHDKAGITERFR